MPDCIIGIDCATDPKKRGVAKAFLNNDAWQVTETTIGLTDHEIADFVIEAKNPDRAVLLALDAPLGWPEQLGESLYNHSAGQSFDRPANKVFRRKTDDFIKKTYGKQPLDVGADRIARTAHSALALLSVIANRIAEKIIPLAWQNNFSGVATIEVYPAATLISYGWPSRRYKKPAEMNVRAQIIAELENYLAFTETHSMVQSADALDAALCVLAGKDFLEGNCYQPENQRLAHKEGWIWVKTKEGRA